MPQLLADECFAFGVVTLLREAGIDVVTVRDLGRADRQLPDDEVLRIAHQTGRVVLTFNRREFIRLHHDGASHVGIIVCKRPKDSNAALADRIRTVLSDWDASHRLLVRIDNPNPSNL